ncbi:MAG: tetraacyldisaccharide 4'-kinase [Bacteroidales bacterium]
MAIHNLRKKLKPILFPLSFFYGLATGMRNFLFNRNILKSVSFDLPVISVGNITVGGTGKTPHVEYLVDLLSKNFSVSVLSRGYKRKTKGFLMADKTSTPEIIGDEPYQVYSKYKNAVVAVDEDRVHGIGELKKECPGLQAVILDDAFQHRYVSPGVSILLIDYFRPVYNDSLLPAGDLREPVRSVKRANIIIVTKVPEDFKPIEKRLWIKELNLFPYQFLYFTSFEYGDPRAVFRGNKRKITTGRIRKPGVSVLLVTGIANPVPLQNNLSSWVSDTKFLSFPDHHEYTPDDMQTIKTKLNTLVEKDKLIITTEKDAIKIGKLTDVDDAIKERMYYLPVKVKFLHGKQKEFDTHIINYVAKNKRIGRLHR